jgi:hypothetical protein
MVVSFSVAAKDDVVKVYDKGLDGDMRVYSIGCPNGKKTMITQMFGVYDEAGRSASQNAAELDILRLEEKIEEAEALDDESEDSGTNISSDIDVSTVETETTGSIEQTTTDLKQRFLKLIGQENRAEVCLYPVDAERKCKTYKNIDAAAKAACDLMG